ncbi:MAG: response regulator [Oceanicaulis sp.]
MAGRVLVLEDDDSLRLVISKALSRAGFEVRSTATPQTAIEKMAAGEADALVADVLLGRENFLDRLDEVARLRPDAPVVVMSAQTTAGTAINAAKGGAFEYLPKPFDLDELVAILQRALNLPSAEKHAGSDGYAGLVGRSPAMQDAFRTLGRLAGRREPVLIVGPEGSGRAAAARVLHAEGGGAGPLVEAGPEALADRGAAIFAEAGEGAVLLRRADAWSVRAGAIVLEQLEAEKRGPRVLVTAGPDVRDRLEAPLLDRLAIGLVECPPVRHRGADRSLLFRHFLSAAARGAAMLSSDGARFVDAQAWPGEVLEIKRVAERIAVQGARGEIGPDDVAAAMSAPRRADPRTVLEDAAARLFAALEAENDPEIAQTAQAALETGLIRAALEASGGVRQDAAKRLGMNRNTFARRIAVLGLDDGADAP